MPKRNTRSQADPPNDLNTTMIEDSPEEQIQIADILSGIQELARSVAESRKEMDYLRNEIQIVKQRSETSVSLPGRVNADLPHHTMPHLANAVVSSDLPEVVNGDLPQHTSERINENLPQHLMPPLANDVISYDSSHKLYDLPAFSGRAEDWPLFIANFKETTDMYKYSNRQNLMRLQKSLQGQARETVVSMLIYPSDVPKVIEELEFRFGRPDLLVRSQLMKIQQFPAIGPKRLNQLVEFSTKVRNVVTFLNSANCTHHLMNATLLEELVTKLPMEQQFDWARHAVQIKPYPTLLDFSHWLSDVAKVVSLIPSSLLVMQPKQIMLIDDSKKLECVICKGPHFIIKCQSFVNMPLETRWNKVKELKLCFSCLHKGHGTSTCRKKKPCTIENCKRSHHKLLHDTAKKESLDNPQQIPVVTPIVSAKLQPMLNCRTQQASILFKILPVKISGPAGSLKVFAIFDEGSAVSLIDEQTARQLGLNGKSSPLRLQWYGEEAVTEKSFRVQFEIEGVQPSASKYVLRNVHTVGKMKLPKQSFSKSDYPQLDSIPVEDYSNALPVILLGLDCARLAVPSLIKEGGDFEPIAAQTKLGWVVYGPTDANIPYTTNILTIISDDIHNIVQEYFETESFGASPDSELLLSDENQNAKDILERTTRKIDNQFETGLLWKKYPPNLPPSFEMAKKRLFTIEKKMTQNPHFATKYNQEMDKYLQKGYARKLSDAEAQETKYPIWYLPHFGVVTPHKPDKLRVVFDAAAKVGEVSLNSTLVRGPEQAKPLLGILMKFRQGKIAVAADIKEMFSQVKIRQEDQHSQRFLWRSGNLGQPIQQYVMTSMTFGSICSPCSAEYIKNLNAMQFSEEFPEAVTAIIEKHYVDDFVCSFYSKREALKICQDVVHIHKQGGFELRGFISNDVIIESVMNNTTQDVTTVKMEKQASSEKILGMYWNKQEDTFEFQTKFHCLPGEVLEGIRVPTKRELLKIAMAVFDPFGLIADFLLYSKVLVQRTWDFKLSWDDDIPNELQKKWKDWWNEFKEVRNFKISRCLSPNLTRCHSIQLHVFVDASQDAFAAACYLRIAHNKGIDVSFIIGKVRCAPKKLMSIPRLELQASVLGVRLSKSVIQNCEFKISSVHYWSDSQTVLRWIYSKERRYKAFVNHRIAEILNSSCPTQWNWVPSHLNSADSGTRTVYPPKFNPKSKWLLGPAFLKDNEDCWPRNTINTPSYPLEEELKPQLMIMEMKSELFDYERFSSYGKLKRTTAYINRFAKRQYNKPNQLTMAELDTADKLICRKVQEECFQNEIDHLKASQPVPKSSSIHMLMPYIDNDGLLRVNGRLDEALYLPFDARRPIILPKNHPVSKLIVHYFHEKNHHQNSLLTMNEVRQKYWIPHLKSLMKSVIRNCFVCKFDSATPQQPIMGQLPVDRVTPYVRPFSYTGVDLFGPFNVSIGRRREKRWAVIFTCLTVRAAHIEVAEDLSTEAFILCFRNFINRRGTPVRMRSDNGTNFLGAQKTLKPEDRLLNIDEINYEAVKRNIEWIFNCPANPSSGGCWERLIRIIKRLLQKTLKEIAPRLETLRSVLIEAENVINSRPLTDIPISSKEEEPLTPNHFLIGCLNSTQTPNTTSDEICLRKQWRIAQNLKDRLWKRWVQEYLPQLICRSKWLKIAEPLKLDDIVLVCDPGLPRHQWVKGKIVKIYPSKDGQVRFADVKTTKGITRRPASKIAVLKVNQIDSRGGEM